MTELPPRESAGSNGLDSSPRFFSPRFWTAAASLWTAAILALALVPDAQSGWLMQSLGDKILHGIAFGVGCLLWVWALRAGLRLTRKATILVGAVIAVALGIGVEFLQSYVPSRSADPQDIVADVLGVLPVLVYLTLAEVFRRRRSA